VCATLREPSSETLLLNVAIIPSAQVTTAAIELSRAASMLGGLFELDERSHRPHLTIYMARFARSQVDTIHSILTSFIPSTETQLLRHAGYHLTPLGYYEISYERTPQLIALHQNMTRELYGLRFSPGNPVVEDYFGEYTGATKFNAERWGYDLVGELYRPHITLTRFAAGMRTGQSTSLPRWPIDLSFPFEAVGLFRADRMGSVGEVISVFELNRFGANR